ncbi:MAG TPA: hypothetical protein VJ327_07165 [Patescibacteria group bacterium]|nr:hypothetical protein [Patescibacteria group bacterium]
MSGELKILRSRLAGNFTSALEEMPDLLKADQYRRNLRSLENWEPYLLEESALPGPRANLELAQVVADEGNEPLFLDFISYTPDIAPSNSPAEFLAMCGIIGLGKLIVEGDLHHLKMLQSFASDPRWRIREGVAMALQRLGEKDMDRLIAEMEIWSQGNLLEMRASAAALAEPSLLKEEKHVAKALQILDRITDSLHQVERRNNPEFKALQKGLAYCWSVAVVALPHEGKPMMEKWLLSGDPDIRWIMKENLKKNRLKRLDPEWVKKWNSRLLNTG